MLKEIKKKKKKLGFCLFSLNERVDQLTSIP